MKLLVYLCLFTPVLYLAGRKQLGSAQLSMGVLWVSQKLILIYPGNLCGVPDNVGGFWKTHKSVQLWNTEDICKGKATFCPVSGWYITACLAIGVTSFLRLLLVLGRADWNTESEKCYVRHQQENILFCSESLKTNANSSSSPGEMELQLRSNTLKMH